MKTNLTMIVRENLKKGMEYSIRVKKFGFYSLVFLLLMSFQTEIYANEENETSSNTSTPVETNLVDFNIIGEQMAATDINGDYLDDIITFDPFLRIISVAYQLEDNQFITFEYPLENLDPEDIVYSILTCKFTESAEPSIFVGTDFGIHQNKLNETHTLLSDNQFQQFYFAQNMSAGDVNNDGHLDIFVCNDTDYNKLYLNDGSGNFGSQVIDFNSNTNYANGGDYGSILIDLDDDNDLDLYIAKCKMGELDPTAPERINLLYLNDGNGNFTESTDVGLSDGGQSWTGSFYDLDNDGDLDAIITNHAESGNTYPGDFNKVYINNNGSFTHNENIDIEALQSLQLNVRDFDNNGFKDIMIIGIESFIFYNQGNNQYIKYPISNFDLEMTMAKSAVVSDFDKDGFNDFFLSYKVNGGTGSKNKVFYTIPNNNNFIAFDLKGLEGNIDAIGAKVKIYGSFGIQRNDLVSGDSYGIKNTNSIHFGLGDYTEIDSVVIIWPNQTQEIITNPVINQYHFITQNDTDCGLFDSSEEQIIEMCDMNSDVVITAPNGFNSYVWNTGETTQSITTNLSNAIFYCKMQDAAGCTFDSKRFYTKVVQSQVSFPLFYASDYICHGVSTTICAEPGFYYLWSDGSTNECISVSAGEYTVAIYSSCLDTVYQTAQISETINNQPLSDSLVYTVDEGDDLELTVTPYHSGDIVFWYSDLLGTNLIHTGETLSLENLGEDTCFYTTNFGETYDTLSAGKGSLSNTNSIIQVNDQMGLLFDVTESFHLVSLDVYSAEDVEQKIVIENLGTGQKKNVLTTLQLGLNIVEITHNLVVGSYKIYFENPSNMYLDNQNVSFPYNIEGNHGTISSTINDGTDQYDFFYNWVLSDYFLNCESEPLQICINVQDTTTSVSNNPIVANDEIVVYPTPTRDLINVEINNPDYKTLFVYNSNGQLIKKYEIRNQLNIIDLSSLSSGLYLLGLQSDVDMYFEKILKID